MYCALCLCTNAQHTVKHPGHVPFNSIDDIHTSESHIIIPGLTPTLFHALMECHKALTTHPFPTLTGKGVTGFALPRKVFRFLKG